MISLALLALSVDVSFANIEIAVKQGSGFSPCEPSVAISRTNPDVIVAGAVLDNVMVSQDGGKTWQQSRLKSEFGVYGDPTVISNAAGEFFYFHLANPGPQDRWLERLVCQKSTDSGKSWVTKSGVGHNPPKHQDKQWPAVHPTKDEIVLTWTQFDKYGEKDLKFESNILFSKSVDGGKLWSSPVEINDVSGDCVDGDDTTEGAVPAVGKDGVIYVTWSAHGVIWFDQSVDGGKTWGNDRAIARQFGGWDQEIPGIGRANGMPVLMMDNSGGVNDGNLYCLFADQRAGERDTDIFMIRSTDKGATWSEAKRVNQDGAGAHQFFPWLAVDQATGDLFAVYYDRRGLSGFETNVFVAWSRDGGVTWRERRVNREVIDMQPKGFFGDYNNIAAQSGRVVPVWTGVKDGVTSIWAGVLNLAELERN